METRQIMVGIEGVAVVVMVVEEVMGITEVGIDVEAITGTGINF